MAFSFTILCKWAYTHSNTVTPFTTNKIFLRKCKKRFGKKQDPWKRQWKLYRIMADSLSLLRQFTIDEKHIEEREDQIIFNEFSWNKDSLTNFISYRSVSILVFFVILSKLSLILSKINSNVIFLKLKLSCYYKSGFDVNL